MPPTSERSHGIDNPPSDTYMRERLDEVNPRDLRRCFTDIFAPLQRGKVFEPYTVLDGHLAIAVDGTGTFSSHTVHCDHCCVKNHQDGSKTYYQGAILVWCANFCTICCVSKLPAQRELHDCHWRVMWAPSRLGD